MKTQCSNWAGIYSARASPGPDVRTTITECLKITVQFCAFKYRAQQHFYVPVLHLHSTVTGRPIPSLQSAFPPHRLYFYNITHFLLNTCSIITTAESPPWSSMTFRRTKVAPSPFPPLWMQIPTKRLDLSLAWGSAVVTASTLPAKKMD